MRCDNCGAENRAGVRYCEQCGQPLASAAPQQAAPPAAGTGGVACPACGYGNRPGVRFCERCGQPLLLSGSQTAPPSSVVASNDACPACGNVNRPDIQFCENCGQRLPAPGQPAHHGRFAGSPIAKWWRSPDAVGLGVLRLRRAVRRGLTVVVLLAAIAAGALYSQRPSVSRQEAVDVTRQRLESIAPNAAGAEPTVRTRRSWNSTTYTIEYPTEIQVTTGGGEQTVSGKVVFIVDAETGETTVLATR